MPLPPLTLVLGAASSGKSAFAEALVLSRPGARRYIATAEAWDDEMRVKIAQHQAQRGPDWRTIEAPLDIATAIAGTGPQDTILIDCATLWLSNHMLAGHDCEALSDDLIAALTACPARVVIVSNEVGLGLVPDTPLGRQFRDAQGRLNQRLAARADTVVFVVAGLPMVVKGEMPPMI